MAYNFRSRKEHRAVLSAVKDAFPSSYISNKLKGLDDDSEESDGYETVSDDSTYEPSEVSDDELDTEDSDDCDDSDEYETISDESGDSDESDDSSESGSTLNQALLNVFGYKPTVEPKGVVAKKFFELLKRKPTSTIGYFNQLLLTDQQRILEQLRGAMKSELIPVPMDIRIIDSSIPDDIKMWALHKWTMIKQSHDGEVHKHLACLEALLRIPFGKFSQLPISLTDGVEKCSDFLDSAQKMLDKNTHGLNDAKDQIMQFLGQLLANPKMTGQSIVIKGPMGTGKSSLIKDIGTILRRPVEVITLGGAKDCSDLDGHSFTYEGSRHGRILEALMRWQTMDPVFHFDELDKTQGPEIANLLMHVTDKTLNHQYRDKYFPFSIDLSRALFVFTMNDGHVDPVLLDRMYKVETTGYSSAEKIVIAQKYTIQDACRQMNFEPDQIIFTDATIIYMIENYTANEKGVRNMKRCIETIISKLNMDRLLKRSVTFPVTVTPDLVRQFLKEPEYRGYTSMYS
jgi:ATP-dependent Lon protease